MARIVSKVPNPWEQFMDGNIWELSQEEMADMPNFHPMLDCTTNEMRGRTLIQWYRNGMYYIRFLRQEDIITTDWLDRAAGGTPRDIR